MRYGLNKLENELDKELNRETFVNVIRYFLIFIFTVASAVIMIIFINMPLLQIKSSGLSPVLKNGEYVLCRKGLIKKGSIIALDSDKEADRKHKKVIVKRIDKDIKKEEYDDYEEGDIIGRVVFIIWPLKDAGKI